MLSLIQQKVVDAIMGVVIMIAVCLAAGGMIVGVIMPMMNGPEPAPVIEPFLVNKHGQRFIRVASSKLDAWLQAHVDVRIISISSQYHYDCLVVYEEAQ